ncbi:phosphotransferase family protein [Streptomyces yaizuensis]|uniref:Phosphotransferase n=1 Tax=Streptomyces yaizuensis TaxID=2989713 RepID=A0ABQ5NXW6_9ACTN|nr:aminoglycoside phosphotransferase family protein [Streptomyces sp. YSPA8]GLF95220.1 phosphotransferase [Streptomyces sp. YSPA8]
MTNDVGGARPGLTSASAVRPLELACRAAGLDSRGAALIRLGENALFRLAGAPVIVRIARSQEYLPQVANEVAVSRWLAVEGFPAARVVEEVEQPVVVAGHPVTFWHLIAEGARKASYGELGGMLRALHALTLPKGLRLPPFDVFGRTDLRIERAAIPGEDRVFLRRRLQQLRDAFEAVRFTSAPAPVHGDAHVQNLMVDAEGRVVLIDFENFSFDHPEWDLMVTAVEHHSLGWQTPAQYADFVDAYGRDLHGWPGYELLRGIQEFRMTTWLMQNVTEDAVAAAEYRQRIASLRDDLAPRNWQPA